MISPSKPRLPPLESVGAGNKGDARAIAVVDAACGQTGGTDGEFQRRVDRAVREDQLTLPEFKFIQADGPRFPGAVTGSDEVAGILLRVTRNHIEQADAAVLSKRRANRQPRELQALEACRLLWNLDAASTEAQQRQFDNRLAAVIHNGREAQGFAFKSFNGRIETLFRNGHAVIESGCDAVKFHVERQEIVQQSANLRERTCIKLHRAPGLERHQLQITLPPDPVRFIDQQVYRLTADMVGPRPDVGKVDGNRSCRGLVIVQARVKDMQVGVLHRQLLQVYGWRFAVLRIGFRGRFAGQVPGEANQAGVRALEHLIEKLGSLNSEVFERERQVENGAGLHVGKKTIQGEQRFGILVPDLQAGDLGCQQIGVGPDLRDRQAAPRLLYRFAELPLYQPGREKKPCQRVNQQQDQRPEAFPPPAQPGPDRLREETGGFCFNIGCHAGPPGVFSEHPKL